MKRLDTVTPCNDVDVGGGPLFSKSCPQRINQSLPFNPFKVHKV